jgi:hypothetical protein
MTRRSRGAKCKMLSAISRQFNDKHEVYMNEEDQRE